MSDYGVGFLNLNKPAGWTSHDCVAKVRKLLQQKRVGHGGTLDPLATGVLPIAVGKATRLLNYLPEEKAYRAKIRFGLTTTTDDLAGEILSRQSAVAVTLEQIQACLPQFLGTIKQIPPAYSAISVGGKRLYQLARQGEVIVIPERLVSVKNIAVLQWWPGEAAELELLITCGPGTYIRALARDLGQVLGVGATLSHLTRTLSCGFELNESLTIFELEEQLTQGNFQLIPMTRALQHLSTVSLELEWEQRWHQGQSLSIDCALPLPRFVQVQNPEGNFLGIGEISPQANQVVLIPKIVF